jgi:hypothetical protein
MDMATAWFGMEISPSRPSVNRKRLQQGEYILYIGSCANIRQAKGGPFSVSTPSNRHLCVSSPDLIKEYTDAPAYVLSLHAAAKEV